MRPFGLLLQVLVACALLHSVLCRTPLLVVSCDGFRYDYLDWYPEETKFLRSLIPLGVHVKRMRPTFTSKTFPAHWTIATGLYEESHGITANSMYDPVFKSSFNPKNREERWWNTSEPIWISARNQGLKSATYFWPGSEIQFNGVRQNFYYEYDAKVSFDVRVKKVIDWLTVDKVDLAMMYFDQPDVAGHNFGPRSTEVQNAVRKVDDTILSLFVGLKERKYDGKVNIMIVSDHGMARISPDKVVNFTDSLDQYVDRYLDSGPLFGVNPKPGKKDELLTYLRKEARTKNLPVRVYAKEELPERYHYSKNRRIPEVLVLPDQGYVVVTSRDKPLSKGNHGFDDQYCDMTVPLFAVGPNFQSNVVLENFRQVDIYGLMCNLLHIKPQPNNGSLVLLPKIIRSSSSATLIDKAKELFWNLFSFLKKLKFSKI